MVRIVVALALFAAAGSPVAQPQPKNTTYALIRCESQDYRDSYCPADTRRGVQLVNELSRGRCRLGQSWGYDRGGIWVDQGCRAEFEIGSYGGGGYGWGWGYDQGDYLVCESRDFRYQFCNAQTRGGVRLVNQISRSECIEGRTWGYDRRGVWVDQGCAGEFETGRGGGGGGGGGWDGDRPGGGWGGGLPSAELVVCESKDDRRRFCAVDLRHRRVSVAQNLSRVPCSEGRNWGWDDRGIWVDDGCRAEFRITGGRDPDWGGGRPGGGSGGAVATVFCESRDFRRNWCEAETRGGVRLERQRSKADCIEGRTWGYDRRGIWVDQGCAGDFTILGWR